MSEPILAVFGNLSRVCLAPSLSQGTLRQTYIHTYGQFIVNNSTAYLWAVGGSRTTRTKPTQTGGEHANPIQLGIWAIIIAFYIILYQLNSRLLILVTGTLYQCIVKCFGCHTKISLFLDSQS